MMSWVFDLHRILINMIKHCKSCKKEYLASPSKKIIYCSNKCKRVGHSEWMKENKIVPPSQKKHGQAIDGKNTKTYKTWLCMRARCNNIKDTYKYSLYGGRGIKVCKRWYVFEKFYLDMGKRPEGKTLDRINSNGNYCKKNCRWSTPKEQANNRRIKTKI